MVVPDLWWLVARGTANASESKVAFRCSYDTIASYHQSSGEGGFHFGDFVSPSLYKGRCCASRRRCQQLDHACVGFMLFATATMTHFTVSPTLRLFLDNVEPREYARELLETNLAMGRCVSKPRRQSTSGKPHVRRVPVQTLLGYVLPRSQVTQTAQPAQATQLAANLAAHLRDDGVPPPGLTMTTTWNNVPPLLQKRRSELHG